MRIGILTHRFMNWGGGIDFIRSIVESLISTNEDIELHFFIPDKGSRLFIYNLCARTLVTSSSIIGNFLPSPTPINPKQILAMIGTVDSKYKLHFVNLGLKEIKEICIHEDIQVLLPSLMVLPKDFEIPWIGYISDFQHKYLPHLFTTFEIRRRDKKFAEMLENARVILVNSSKTADDIAKFYPSHRSTLIRLPFNASPKPSWFLQDFQCSGSFDIKTPYFIICNQFWQHKGHELAFKAFSRLIERNPYVNLVCTGSTVDGRNRSFFSHLMLLTKELQLIDNIHILGLLPKLNQIQLMKSAIALIQPTYFEGAPGGGAVYDAISLGVPAIVSDIPVNKELSNDLVAFFRVGDIDDLVVRMQERINLGRATSQSPSTLLQKGMIRRQSCGFAIINSINIARN